jgi:biofilm protein TabA
VLVIVLSVSCVKWGRTTTHASGSDPAPPVSLLASGSVRRWIAAMAIFGSLATVRAQAPQTPAFATAWAYLDRLVEPGSDLNRRILGLAVGASEKHELGGGVFAIEQAYDTKPRAEGFFESHRKYIDIQVVVSGGEIMEVIDRSQATVRDAYLEERDLITYADAPTASPLRLSAGQAAIFFPVDVHMPTLRLGAEAVRVHKSVVKVPISA